MAHAPCAQRAQPRSAISPLPCWLASRPACGLTVPSTVVPLPRPFLLLSPMPTQHEAVECEREREVHGQVQQVLHAGGRTCRAQTTIAYRGLGRHGQSTFSFLQMPFFACAPQSSNGEPLNPWNKSTSMHGRGGGFVAMYTKICNAHGFNRSNNRDRRPVRDGMRTGMLACPPLSACCALVRVAVPCRRWGSSRASESDRATLLFRPASTRRAATSC